MTRRWLVPVALVCAHCSSSTPERVDEPLREEDAGVAMVEEAGASIGATCASRSALTCARSCRPDEACFTEIICPIGPPDAGPLPCYAKGPGDERCHRKCKTATDCATGESCSQEISIECTDWGPKLGICRSRQ